MPTFGQVWRSAAAKHPGVPPLVVRSFAQDAWKALADSRQWGWRRQQQTFLLRDARDLEVTVTQNSTTVTSAALFVAADLYRQFRVGTYPVYTINEFVSTSEITLDRVYTGASDTDDAQILDAYLTVPDNFQQFLLVVDLAQQCRIGHWYTQEQLSLLDPVRTNASDGSPRGLFAAGYDAIGRLRYEVWPYTNSEQQLPYWYTTIVADLADDEDLPGVFKTRGDVLETGARVECARFAGTPAQKNVGYDLVLAERLDQNFRELLRQLTIRDDDQYFQDLVQYSNWPLAALAPTADYLRRTDWPAGTWDWGIYY